MVVTGRPESTPSASPALGRIGRMSESTDRPVSRWLLSSAAVVVAGFWAIAVIPATTLPMTDPDTFWHIRAGREFLAGAGIAQHGHVEHCRGGPALGEPGLAEQRRHGLGIRCRHVGSIGPVGAVRRHRRSGPVAAVERDRGAQPGDRLAGPVGMAPVWPRPGGAGPRRSRAGDRPLPRGGGRQRPVALPAGSASRGSSPSCRSPRLRG